MTPRLRPPILLVEDDPSDVDLTRRAFARNRVANPLLIARDGEEALEHLLGATAGSVAPALVLMDLKLPRIDGLEVLRRLRLEPRTRRVPVVILSSSLEPRDLAASYDHGANGYVRKPVEFEAFSEAVRRLADYWLELNQPASAADGWTTRADPRDSG